MNATTDLSGDILDVRWTGSVWEAPCNGTQHGTVNDAMRQEIYRYLSDCGELPEGVGEPADLDMSEYEITKHGEGCSCGAPHCSAWQAQQVGGSPWRA